MWWNTNGIIVTRHRRACERNIHYIKVVTTGANIRFKKGDLVLVINNNKFTVWNSCLVRLTSFNKAIFAVYCESRSLRWIGESFYGGKHTPCCKQGDEELDNLSFKKLFLVSMFKSKVASILTPDNRFLFVNLGLCQISTLRRTRKRF